MSKLNRNDDCPCGSGIKYKKCCLSRNILIPSIKNKEAGSSKKILIKTLTNEFFQPMRLYYIVHNKDELIARFKNLKCMMYDAKLDDWTLEYSNEASNIGLEVSPEKVPEEANPLIIATIYIENDTTMLIDVRSIERAQKLVEFIRKHIPRNIAEVTHAAIYNELITASSDHPDPKKNDIDYDEIFSQKNIFVVDPEKIFCDIESLGKKYKNKTKRLEAIIQKAEENAKKPLPKVEKFPLYLYEEGIDQFSRACQMRQCIAIKHYYGYSDYSFYDLAKSFSEHHMENQDKGGWVRNQAL
jgi:hypothetical protein